MAFNPPLAAPTLPPQVQQALDEFLKAAQSSFGDELRSVILFGSAAEGKLRATSDVNVVLVLSLFEQESAEQLRQPLRLAQASIQLRAMFLLVEELLSAVCSFASKFADIARRRVILFGEDPFVSLSIPREAAILQLKQQLLNLSLRLRYAYVALGLREEQLFRFLANMIGSLRSAAASLRELEGFSTTSSQEAFLRVGRELGIREWPEMLDLVSTLQEGRPLQPSAVPKLFFALIDFCHLAIARVDALPHEASRESV